MSFGFLGSARHPERPECYGRQTEANLIQNSPKQPNLSEVVVIFQVCAILVVVVLSKHATTHVFDVLLWRQSVKPMDCCIKVLRLLVLMHSNRYSKVGRKQIGISRGPSVSGRISTQAP